MNGNGGDGGPGTAASLGVVRGVTISATGDLYITDFSNQRIRRVSASPTLN